MSCKDVCIACSDVWMPSSVLKYALVEDTAVLILSYSFSTKEEGSDAWIMSSCVCKSFGPAVACHPSVDRCRTKCAPLRATATMVAVAANNSATVFRALRHTLVTSVTLIITGYTHVCSYIPFV